MGEREGSAKANMARSSGTTKYDISDTPKDKDFR